MGQAALATTEIIERGLMVLGCGETTLRLSPPLVVTEQKSTVAVDIFEECLRIVEKEQSATLAAATGSNGICGDDRGEELRRQTGVIRPAILLYASWFSALFRASDLRL